ncbi:uncharacterized protein LOC115610462 isoform X2 [Strigops habroptila]|uniref:uncharacterized protein LOC115610462 isoform X2 n=1 Tax=Strigops habroptila TaxID=2489341 RepID=UPI0011CFDFE8|nr:uncharacterized protein LOC115610462 isoform X2 [Strigops habroptila]
MYSPGEGRDESVFNLPAINFNQTPGCCTARTPRLLSASPSPLSPMSTSTTCLHMQHLSECAMSFLLGSAASFTVDWFLFRNRGQAAGVGNGPNVRCMVDGSAAPAPRALAAGGGRGSAGWGVCVCVPHPARSCGDRGNDTTLPPPHTHTLPPRSRPRGQCMHSCLVSVGTIQLFQAGEVCPSRSNLLRSVTPPFSPLPLPAAERHAQTRHRVCPPELVRSNGKQDHKCNRL